MRVERPEFQRQLRNLFAVLRAVVRRTSVSHSSVAEYSAHLESRIGALARVHDMLLRVPEEGVDLQELICAEILSQSIPDDRYELRGPEIRLAPDFAAPLGLAIHELTLNALVHGAFATPAGRVAVTWACVRENDADWLRLDWRESSAARAITSHPRRGFGRELIERTLKYELCARTSVEFNPGGVSVAILIPAQADTTIWREGALPADHDTTQ
jgi:two-component system, chemotaxis family, CheB/CheR fusion protein